MIKRTNKIVALMLVATTVATVAPTTLFNKIANAAEIGQATEINMDEQTNTLADSKDSDVNTSIKKALTNEYKDKGAVATVFISKSNEIKDEPVKTLNVPLTTNMANKIASKVVTNEMIDSMIPDQVIELKTFQYIKGEMQKKVPTGVTITDAQVKEYMATLSNDELKVIKDKVRVGVRDQVKKVTIDTLTKELEAASKNIPIYKYAAVNAQSQPVGTGFVVGGDMGALLLQAGNGPVKVDGDQINNSVIAQIIKQITEKIQNIETGIDGLINSVKDKIDNTLGRINDTIGGINDVVGDLSDAFGDLSDSLGDKTDDVDDAWDKVFDKFDNSEGWGKRDGYIYYYDSDGVSLKGVQNIKGKTYYFNRIDGAMETGWQIVDGKRSYFDKKKGYQVFTKWIQDDKDWYFIDENGATKKSAWIQDGNNMYYVKADGKMTTGWLKVKDYWYYFNENGTMATSTWKWSTDSWYYLKADGSAANDWEQLDGKWYCFKDPSGDMQTGWFRNDGKWYCTDNGGAMKTGWAYSSDGWCYLDETTGQMKKNEWVTVNGEKYYFNVNGVMITGSRYIDGTKYKFNSDGTLQ